MSEKRKQIEARAKKVREALHPMTKASPKLIINPNPRMPPSFQTYIDRRADKNKKKY